MRRVLSDEILPGVRERKEDDMTEQYIVLDLETTGLSPKDDKILEIGAARIADGCVQEVYQAFVDPHIKIPERITELTGITDEMVIGQRSEEHTSELQSRFDLVCRLLLEKKKTHL